MSDNERTVIFQLPSVLAGQIVCVEGTVAGRSWDLSAGTFVIGRRPGCDLYLPQEPGVSKTHAKIIADGEQYVLVDEESRNGTIINGRAVRRQPLLDGDTIQICGCKLRFSQATGASEKTAVSPGMSTSVPSRRPVEAPMDFPPPHEDTHVDPDTSVDPPIAALEPDLMPLHPPSEPPMPPVAPPGRGELVDFTPPGMDIPGPPATPPPTDAWAPQNTELSRPQVAAPGTQAVRRGSTTPSFFVGLFVALFIGGGAYAGMLFVGEGRVPGAMADGDGPTPEGPADPALATDPAATDTATADATPLGDAETDPAQATEPADAENPPVATADATATDPAAGQESADQESADQEPADQEPADHGTETAAAEDDSEPTMDAAPRDDEPAATPRKARKTKTRRSGRRRTAAASTDEIEDDDEDEEPAASVQSTTLVPVNVSAGRAKMATVSAKSSGTVKTVAVKVGDEVEAGELLVELSASDEDDDLGRLEESVRALEEVVRSSGSEEAKQALEVERRKLNEAKNKGGGKGGPVTAPISGRVTAVAVKVGQGVSSGKTVATIESSGKAMVYATVTAKQAQKLRVGATVKLKTKAGDISAKVVSKSKTRSGRYTVNIDPGATDAYDVQGLKL